MPKLVQVEVLACIDLSAWVFCRIFILPSKEILQRRGGLLRLASRITALFKHIPVLEKGFKGTFCVLFKELNVHFVIRRIGQEFQVSIEFLELVQLEELD